MVEIKIVVCECGGYEIDAPNKILGTMYEDGVENIKVVKPEVEKDSDCTMIITHNGVVVDRIDVKGEQIPVTNNMSKYNQIRIGFSFIREDGSTKNTLTEQFLFFPAQKPDDFVPIEPEQTVAINKLTKDGFTSVSWKVGGHNTLQFFNTSGDVVNEIELSGFATQNFVSNAIKTAISDSWQSEY